MPSLLSINSIVLKQLHIEFFRPLLLPFVHYIPLASVANEEDVIGKLNTENKVILQRNSSNHNVDVSDKYSIDNLLIDPTTLNDISY